MNRDVRIEYKRPLKKFKQDWDKLLEEHHKKDERRDYVLARLQQKHGLDEDRLQ